MSRRVERFSSTLKQCLAEVLLNEISNPALRRVLITDVLVSRDLKKARVFVTALPGEGDADEGEKAVTEIVSQLSRACGYLKRILAKKMYVKYMPDLIFVKSEHTDAFLTQEDETGEHYGLDG